MKTLIANRGEIAVRIQRALAELGWPSVAVHVPSERDALAVELADESVELPTDGVAGYLDAQAVVDAAVATGCEAVHPGYGFLSESADLARRCAQAGLRFVGPDPDTLALFGDKARARTHAIEHGVPVLAATDAGVSVTEAEAFLAAHPGGIMIKATAGGGGRGMRTVTDPAEVAGAYERCRSEAMRSFGDDTVYAEALLPRARHLEVQVVGDGSGRVVHLGERDCSLQRRRQKVVEIAPAPRLDPRTRKALHAAAVALIEPVAYRGLATVEFLVDADDPERYVFLEVNPRVQVEHTVTEEITGVDLVTAQLRIAAGATLGEVGLPDDVVGPDDRYAIQLRVNAERYAADGSVVASAGTVERFAVPDEPDVRVDTHVRSGTVVEPGYDPLLAKIVVTTTGTFAHACAAALELAERTDVTGIETNLPLLRSLLADPAVTSGQATTDLVDARTPRPRSGAKSTESVSGSGGHAVESGREVVTAAFPGSVVAVEVAVGDEVSAGTPLVVLESMKMEHPVAAPYDGIVREVQVEVGDQVVDGAALATVEPGEVVAAAGTAAARHAPDHVRPDLAEVHERHRLTRDDARPEAVAKRHALGHRTARENVDDLCDDGSFVEYGALPVAAQRTRRDLDDLIRSTPADGIVTGLATVNAAEVGEQTGQVAVLAYDYTVLAGTQGFFSHKKTDRMLAVAQRLEVPVVFFTEGGGGRPGDTDTTPVHTAGLDVGTFSAMASLSGTVPTVGVLTGRCFAGNAALLGCCDVIIATRDSTLGMAGPAMIEGGGLGTYAPEEVGPMSVQGPNGVVDVLVDDDAEAVAVAQRYLSYFQGPVRSWAAPDQRALRHVIGENRLRVYDVREVIETLADVDSVLELRREFGTPIVTALVRIEGRPYGLVANDPAHLGGAIDADGADKMARFLQLCDAHGLPIVSLCDTPGFMVGPDAERTATVRHFSRLFVIGSHLRVPITTVVLRKAYGLGAQAMAGGGFHKPVATLAWPTGEIGPMGLEGAVRLGYSRELGSIDDPEARRARYDELVAQHYEAGKALNAAMTGELDDVIDPADTRRWLISTLGAEPVDDRPGRGYIDTW
ncbi:acetyl-CoA carboxylase carboxyltransferase component [Mumia flava]|uniref:Acetyl-CoA carboxylase carboxyltransferase component n=1 Tax=Mumia flava TaxID=1348852 RepID=A0A0B2BEG5_9ACTN|nr:carboxyl transferase domain-containing protein [Mumia flava]PJJ57423.1 acetyl-CoA carboxylase carboxyltransferase component [Mumia flava]